MSFDAGKAANVAAYFIKKAGGKIHARKLLALMYLTERESLKKYGWQMTEDALVNMPEKEINKMVGKK